MSDSPKISVVMPAYNSSKYIGESIESILNQTFENFELLVINDKSTDNTAEIVNSYAQKDPRVKLLDNIYEKGIVGGLNTGLEKASGDFIARLDSDDIAYPERFNKQVKFLELHPEIGLCGTWYEMFGIFSGIRTLPLDNDAIKATMLFYGAIAHPSVMIRNSVLKENNLKYDQNFIWSEDLDLWVRMSKVTKLANLPVVLLKYRTHDTSVTNVHTLNQAERVKEIHLRELKDLGIDPSKEEIALHEKIGFWNFVDDKDFLKSSINWFKKLSVANIKTNFVQPTTLSKFLSNKVIDEYIFLKHSRVNSLFIAYSFFLSQKALKLTDKMYFMVKLVYKKLKF